MFKVRLADLTVAVDNKYNYIEEMCAGYVVPHAEHEDFCVSATDDEISAEGSGEECAEYLETLALYRKIAEELPFFDGFLIHGVLLDCEGRGVLFCADSGTGKTTHAMLWLRLLGDKCRIINGDKPLLRVFGGKPYGYGTPWCGKEQININARVPVSAVCFLERARENSADEVNRGEVLENLIPHVYIPSGSGFENMLSALDAAARGVRFYKIRCNMDISAAETSYGKIFGK